MLLTLTDAKEYLRVDYSDEDNLISGLISAAEELCAHIARRTVEELCNLESDNVKTAVLYAVAYFYEHREDADHHALTLTLRSLLFGIRKEGF